MTAQRSLVAVLLACATLAGAQTAPSIVIKAGRLIDPETGTAAANQTIVVQAGKIAAIGANLPTPPGAEVIDLS